MLGSYRDMVGAEEIPPVKWRPLADRSCTNVDGGYVVY